MDDTPRDTAPAPAGVPARLNADLPYLTAGLPGIGGTLRTRVEDFQVEEIPAYAPEGAGEFLFLWVEKRGLSAEQLTSHLARALGIAHQDVGMAGLKDRHAVTRQMVSVPARCEPRLGDLRNEQIRILSTARHRNKLRTGHLRGNRFEILVRDAAAGAVERAVAVAARLREQGVPNYFGEQRFGRDAETVILGFDLLRGLKQPGDIPRARRKFLLRLALSAAQSALFNQTLAERLIEGALHRVIPGDVMQVVASHGQFVAEDVPAEQARLDAGEIVPTGPIFGPKMLAPAGEIARREAQLLAECHLTKETFTRYAKLTSGTRRAYLVRPQDLEVGEEAAGIRLQFTLPSGCYATVLLREFQK